MDNNMMSQEAREALEAGERALRSLREAQNYLQSAKNWGFWDMFGGNLITTAIKHTKMDNASACMENAKYDLQIFQKELRDVYITLDMRIDVDGFLNFADYFFDDFVSDYMVQSKINKAKEQVDSAINQIEGILMELRRY